jgi:hypothetical protein
MSGGTGGGPGMTDCRNHNRNEEVSMAKRKAAAKRTLVDTKRGGKRFVRRATDGTFKESDQVGRSLSADRRKKAKTKARRGQGDKGDR